MSILVTGGSGFIGRRLVPLLAERGHQVVCMDVKPDAAPFEGLGAQVRVRRGDVSQFGDVMAAMTAPPKPTRVINLAYGLGEYSPHAAFKLNVLGMENCFEAARLSGIGRVVFASSLAVSGPQHLHGEHHVTERDLRRATTQYGTHKIFNEGQARDYCDQHGMEITAIRPANVTGSDKIVGSLDHVFCITNPARDLPARFPYRDTMRCPIHVDEVAEIFARVTLTDEPKHRMYNTGGTAISIGGIADLVREVLPDPRIAFDHDTGGRELSTNPLMDSYLIDNRRLVDEFGIRLRPYREQVRQIIDDVRREAGLPPVRNA